MPPAEQIIANVMYEFEQALHDPEINPPADRIINGLRAYLTERKPPSPELRALLQGNMHDFLEHAPTGMHLAAARDAMRFVEAVVPLAAVGPDVNRWLQRTSAIDTTCTRDTNGDGDCAACAKLGACQHPGRTPSSIESVYVFLTIDEDGNELALQLCDGKGVVLLVAFDEPSAAVMQHDVQILIQSGEVANARLVRFTSYSDRETLRVYKEP